MIHLATDQGSPAEPLHKSIEVQGKTLEFTYTEGSNVFAGISLEWMLLLIGEIERLRQVSAAICIDFKQATDILAMFGGQPGEVTLLTGDGHGGRGLYAHYSEYPEEGAEFLGVADEEAMPVPETITPLTDERIRELWVEHGLDECDPEGFARIIEAEVRAALAQPAPVQHNSDLLLGWKRYEKLRKLSPAMFTRLHIANTTGGGAFDDLVDKLPEPSTPVPEAAHVQQEATGDAALLDALRDESWDLCCFTAADDAVGWRVVAHYMAAPHERTVAEVYEDDPRAAIRAALQPTQGEDSTSADREVKHA